MKLRIIQKFELAIIEDLAHKTWFSAYQEIISLGQIHYMLDNFYNIASLEKQFENGHIFLLAEENNQPIGFCSFEFNCQNSGETKIHKLYVLPEIQGKSVGKSMVEFVKNNAIEKQEKGLFLNVNKNNKALYFYEKLGFTTREEVVLDIGNGYVMDDYIMELIFE